MENVNQIIAEAVELLKSGEKAKIYATADGCLFWLMDNAISNAQRLRKQGMAGWVITVTTSGNESGFLALLPDECEADTDVAVVRYASEMQQVAVDGDDESAEVQELPVGDVNNQPNGELPQTNELASFDGMAKQVDGKPADEQPADEQPAGEQPAGEEPAGEQPAGEQPAGEEPAGEQPAGEGPVKKTTKTPVKGSRKGVK